MSYPATRQLIDLHAELYQKAYAAAHAFPSVNSPKLRHYAHNFQKMLPDLYWQVKEDELVDRVMQADVLLYGDFHTLKQSQRGLLRLLRRLTEHHMEQRPIVLALEMFSTNQQAQVDKLLSGEIDEVSFRQNIQYEKTWGFPWQHYAPLIEFARARGIKVRAINVPKKTKTKLSERDELIAKELVKIKETNPDSLLVTMIGEYHLADEHLMRQLKQKALEKGVRFNALRLLNNVDRYYFELLKNSHQIMQSEFLKLRDDIYCLINTPAWMKWRSLANWEEMAILSPEVRDHFLEDAGEAGAEFQNVDIDHQFFELTSHLVQFLGLKKPASELQKFHFCLDLDNGIVNKLKKKHHWSKREVTAMLERTELDGAYFLNEERIILLRDLSLNCLGRLAGEFLQDTFSNGHGPLKRTAAHKFYNSVLRRAAGTISINILNPRRKTKTFDDYVSFHQQTQKKQLSGDLRRHRDLSKLLSQHQQWLSAKLRSGQTTYANPIPGLYAFDERSAFSLSIAIGELLGQELAKLFLEGVLDLSILTESFSSYKDDFPSAWSLFLHLSMLAKTPEKVAQAVGI